MRCCDIDRLASTYIDGELDEARASALRGHMRSCERCCAYVEDLARIRDAVAHLEAVEPPSALWSQIEAGLADAEVADANRSRLWLRWQTIRPMLLPGAVALSAAAVLVLWLIEPGRDRSPSPVDTAEMAAPAPDMGPDTRDRSAGPEAGEYVIPEAGESAVTSLIAPPAAADHIDEFSAARTAEVQVADQRYAETLGELREMIADERVSWPGELAKVFDRRMAEFDHLARQERETLAKNQAVRPESRDRLYAIYRAQIAFLQGVVIDGTVSDGAIAQVMRPAGGFTGGVPGGMQR